MTDDTLDRDVREAIEPDTETVNRLVQEALRPDRAQRSWRGPVLTAVAMLLLLASAAMFLRQPPRPAAPSPTRVTNVGDTVVVRPSSGGIWLIGGDAVDADRLPAGTMIVYQIGEGR
jgi:hypothetical protein